MKKLGILTALLTAFLSLFFFTCSTSLLPHKLAPRVENGVLDLTTWNFKKDAPVKLDGQWEFHWKRHLEPDGISPEIPPQME